ncbi:putative helicase [Babesia divergens]|uniref:ATP-dependent RNA helicase n=1 Tax=Babesia divergens TaxID=32595 RepID=A0AAD9LI47_BABDI|nr:putative helicase [Babesia divergens]
MAPTHLLVHQLYHVLSKVIKGSGITVAMEDDIETQEMPSIVIGTPLKLLSKFKIYNLNFKVDVFQNIGILVLDEADQLIEETNEAALREFLKLARNRAKTVLAAATVSNAGRLSTENTIARLFRKLKVVRTDAVHSIPTHIDAEFVYCVDYNQKIETLLDVLQQVGSKERALIFCGSVESSKSLLHAMKAVNPRLDVGVVNRDVDLPTQLAALHPEHGNKFIVCTDTLARGIDLGNVNMVVQFDFPTNVLHYIHRAGRAGRNLQRCKTVLLWTDANREFHTLLYENRNNLTALFSRKRGLRKKLKRGVAITSHAPPEAGLDTNDSM